MNPLKPTIDKVIITGKIRQFFTSRNGEFRGLDLYNFCKDGLTRAVYPDTVLRYMRELKDNGEIKYEQVGSKSDSLYKIKKEGQLSLF